jgi:hypothetical protein
VVSVSVLIVYESMFGNTRMIAEAVAGGLAATGSSVGGVGLVAVEEAPATLPEDVDLLVVGGPTHAFGMTREQTRRDAATRPGALAAGRIGIREWLAGLEVSRAGASAAAFDTRVRRPRVPGSAARGVARRLRSLGLDLVVPPATFWVRGTEGPLYDGERERAGEWGSSLATRAGARQRAMPLPEPHAGGHGD